MHFKATDFNSQYSANFQETPDIRFIIVRHGERIDIKYGSNWYQNQHAWNEVYPWPSHRQSVNDYVLDPPLTAKGAWNASEVGEILRNSNNLNFDFCFSSPAMRCVQTVKSILHGYNSFVSTTPVHICKDLYECYGWMGGPNKNPTFLTIDEWRAAGLPSYTLSSSQNHLSRQIFMKPFQDIQLLNSNPPTNEDELSYYRRSARQIDEIISFIDSSNKRTIYKPTINCLILGHAPTSEVITSHLLNVQPNIGVLNYMSNYVHYLCMVVAERRYGKWSLKTSPLIGTSVSMMERA